MSVPGNIFLKNILLVFLFIPAFPFKTNIMAAGQSVTLDEFINEVTKKHPRFLRLLAERAALKFERVIKSPDSDIFAALSVEYGANIYPSGDPDIDASFSLQKLFLNTGTEVSAEYSITPGSANTYQFEAAIIQPVLNNAFGRQNRLLELMYDVELHIAKYQIVEAYEEYFAALVKTYFQWYANYSRLETAKGIHRDNLKVLEDMRARARKNIALPVDVNKIRLKVLYSEADLLRMQNEYENTLQLIESAMLVDLPAGVRPGLPAQYAVFNATFEEEYAGFEAESRTWKLLSLLEEKAALAVKAYEDDLLPSANVMVRYSVDSDQALMNGTQNNDLFIGFSVSYPIGVTHSRARYESSLIYEKAQKFASQDRKLQLKSVLYNLYNQIRTVIQVLALAERQLVTAREIYKDEYRNFQRGRITLNDLIAASNEVERLKFTVDDLKVERDTLFVEWLRLNDRLVVRLQP